MPDHVGPNLPQLAPMADLAEAPVTSRIRLAMTVIDNDFRHPVMPCCLISNPPPG
jgi:alkanesulfonate monooxygenase SsuD/methylene tetrahydromethanopterin reductase-like flavin-dependent oxidoreductase (luciferase family)